MRENLIVILAGYTDEIREFLHLKPGLKSRLPNHLVFEDFMQAELATIFDDMCRKSGILISAENRELAIAENMKRRKGRYFGNARSVRGPLEGASKAQASRLIRTGKPEKLDRTELARLVAEDLGRPSAPVADITKE